MACSRKIRTKQPWASFVVSEFQKLLSHKAKEVHRVSLKPVPKKQKISRQKAQEKLEEHKYPNSQAKVTSSGEVLM